MYDTSMYDAWYFCMSAVTVQNADVEGMHVETILVCITSSQSCCVKYCQYRVGTGYVMFTRKQIDFIIIMIPFPG